MLPSGRVWGRLFATQVLPGRPSRTCRPPAVRPTPAEDRGRIFSVSQNQAHKWVYLFEEGDGGARALLGGKGAGLADMTRAGLPVPPGFIVTTEACNAYYTDGKNFPEGMWEQVIDGLRAVEDKTGKGFGDPVNPLLVSVRSGAPFSMPGLM